MSKIMEVIRKPWIRILGSVALLALCFIVNRTMNSHGTRYVANIVRIATLPVIVFGILQVIKGISLLFLQASKEKPPKPLPTEPVKVWTYEELFAFLEKERRIILQIGSENPINVQVRFEYVEAKWPNRRGYFTDTVIYRIDEQEFEDFEEFKRTFVAMHPDPSIEIWSATTWAGKDLDI